MGRDVTSLEIGYLRFCVCRGLWSVFCGWFVDFCEGERGRDGGEWMDGGGVGGVV